MNTDPEDLKLHTRVTNSSKGVKSRVFYFSDPRVKGGRHIQYSMLAHTEEQLEIKGKAWFEKHKKDIAKWKEEKLKAQLAHAEHARKQLEGLSDVARKPFVVVPYEHPEMPSNNTASFLLLGSTRSGKSTYLAHLYNSLFKKHVTVCQSMSLANQIYKELGPNVAFTPKYCPEVIHDMYIINRDTKNHYKFLAIIDDCPVAKNDKELMKALCVYRNTDVSVIIANQELSMFNATARSNINFVCLFKLNSDMAIEKCVKSYLRSYFPPQMNLNEMIRAYREATSDHKFFLIDNLKGTVVLTKLNL